MAQYGQQIGKDWYLRNNTPVMWNDDGVFISLESLDSMSDIECAKFGVPRIPEPSTAAPTGQVETGRVLVDVDGQPQWQLTFGEAPKVVLPPLPNISDRQFAYGLYGLNLITFGEALAFTSNGAIPAMLQELVDTLPDSDVEGERTPRKDAMMFLSGAKEYEFAHPLVDVLRQSKGWSVDELRTNWSEWLKL